MLTAAISIEHGFHFVFEILSKCTTGLGELVDLILSLSPIRDSAKIAHTQQNGKHLFRSILNVVKTVFFLSNR